jgi:fluoride exporter
MLREILLIGIGGFFGAISRFLVNVLTNNYVNYFPLGTLTVNVLGCFVVGLISFGISCNIGISSEMRSLIIVGFIGAFTTMSAFAFETFELFELSQVFKASLNIFANISLCIFAVYLGKIVGKLIFEF